MKITLYIKRHKITGKLYFGKTTRYSSKNIDKYYGSGVYWKKHILAHGKDQVETVWCCEFFDQEICSEFCILFSEYYDIVNSDKWANLSIENGIDGAPIGHPSFITDPEEFSRKLSVSAKANWSKPEYREKMKEARKNYWSEERKVKQSETSKLLWTEERREKHSQKLSGRKIGTNKSKGVPKSAEHNRKNSESLKGKPKSDLHKKNLSEAKKIRRVCRLSDKKEMAIITYTKWLLSVDQAPLI